VTDVFEEVEENLRRDRYAQFLRKNAVAIAAAIVAMLAAIGGYQLYQQWREQRAQSFAQRVAEAEDAMARGDFAGAQKSFATIAKGAPAGYRTTALLEQGAALLEQGDKQGALKSFEAAAAASPVPTIRDAARLRAAYVAADEEDFKSLEARVKPLIDANGPFSYQARELLGMQAYAAGDAARARDEFEYLSLALETPQGVRQRAQSALALLGPKPEAAAAAPADAPASVKNPGGG
jgi:hypothetical protein